MQITREELGATFTCKVNSIALVEPLTVDIKPDVHGEYAHTVSGYFAGIFQFAEYLQVSIRRDHREGSYSISLRLDAGCGR